MPSRGTRTRDAPSFRSDASGQQFVLEAVVVAIVLVSTIVLVAEMRPGQPGIRQPETHDRMRTRADYRA